MFDIPGFNPRSMSDEELLSKQHDLSRRIEWASRFGMSTEMVAQMQCMLLSIEATRRERTFRDVFEMRQAALPTVIETDPDLRERDKPESEKNTLGTKAPARPKRPIPMPTPAPVAPQDPTR